MSLDQIGFTVLEQQVSRAIEQLEQLRARNGELEAENARLTKILADAGNTSTKEETKAWRLEREELRSRVAGLVEKLEGLLGTGDAGAV